MNHDNLDVLNQSITFMRAAHAACSESDKLCKFACPLCGNEATAIKDGPSGHVGAECQHCQIGIQE